MFLKMTQLVQALKVGARDKVKAITDELLAAKEAGKLDEPGLNEVEAVLTKASVPPAAPASAAAPAAPVAPAVYEEMKAKHEDEVRALKAQIETEKKRADEAEDRANKAEHAKQAKQAKQF